MQVFVNKSLTYGRGYVYDIQYHIVWCTKYRKPVLFNEVEHTLKRLYYKRLQILVLTLLKWNVCLTIFIYW